MSEFCSDCLVLKLEEIDVDKKRNPIFLSPYML